MATKLIDLDEILGDDKKVRLAGRTYTLPPDLPVELYLRINRFAASGASDVEMIETLYDEMLGLFRYKDPKLEKLPLTMAQIVLAIGRIYGDEEPDDDAGPPPPARKSSGTASSRGRSQKTSRSRS